MEPEILSNQPQLALTPSQIQVLSAYLADAIEKLSSVQFRQDKKEDAIYFYIYQAGRKDLAMELLNFDRTTAAAAQEAANANSTTEG